jgi:hypothetical protein
MRAKPTDLSFFNMIFEYRKKSEKRRIKHYVISSIHIHLGEKKRIHKNKINK